MSLYFPVTLLSQLKVIGKRKGVISCQHSNAPKLPAPAVWSFTDLLSLAAKIYVLVESNCFLSSGMKETSFLTASCPLCPPSPFCLQQSVRIPCFVGQRFQEKAADSRRRQQMLGAARSHVHGPSAPLLLGLCLSSSQQSRQLGSPHFYSTGGTHVMRRT